MQIEITANLDFSRMALLSNGGGAVSIDPVSGGKHIRASIANLGGMALHGEGRLTGEPGRNVRIFLPERIQLSAPNGSTAELNWKNWKPICRNWPDWTADLCFWRPIARPR